MRHHLKICHGEHVVKMRELLKHRYSTKSWLSFRIKGFFVIRAQSVCPGCTAALRLIVQPF